MIFGDYAIKLEFDYVAKKTKIREKSEYIIPIVTCHSAYRHSKKIWYKLLASLTKAFVKP